MSETIQYKGFTITIKQDELAENPRAESEPASTMVCEHSRYNLGDGRLSLLYDALSEHPLWHECYGDHRSNKYVEPDDAATMYAMARRFGFQILPLYLYDHSCLTMNTVGFSCPWDSGQVGYIFMSPAQIRDTFMLKPKQRISDKIKKLALKLLKNDVEEYDMYLRGEAYCFDTEDPDGDNVDSCCGFYGYDYCLEDAKESVDVHIRSNHEKSTY